MHLYRDRRGTSGSRVLYLLSRFHENRKKKSTNIFLSSTCIHRSFEKIDESWIKRGLIRFSTRYWIEDSRNLVNERTFFNQQICLRNRLKNIATQNKFNLSYNHYSDGHREG